MRRRRGRRAFACSRGALILCHFHLGFAIAAAGQEPQRLARGTRRRPCVQRLRAASRLLRPCGLKLRPNRRARLGPNKYSAHAHLAASRFSWRPCYPGSVGCRPRRSCRVEHLCSLRNWLPSTPSTRPTPCRSQGRGAASRLVWQRPSMRRNELRAANDACGPWPAGPARGSSPRLRRFSSSAAVQARKHAGKSWVCKGHGLIGGFRVRFRYFAGTLEH